MDDRLTRDLDVLLDLFRQDGWREVSVRSGNLSLLLSSSHDTQSLSTAPQTLPAIKAAPVQARAAPDQDEAPRMSAAIDPTWQVVPAPNLGTFYRSPKPGSPAFVEVGQVVEQGAELCLVEVMKLFTSVRSPVSGTVTHIAATDAELVEGGQPLMYIGES